MKTVALTALVCLAALTGCATAPVPASQAKQAPQDRVYLAKQSIADAGRISFVRDAGGFGSACFLGVRLNKQLAARLDTSEIVTFDVAPGEVLVGAGRDPQGSVLCGASGEWVQRETTIKPGEHKTFRVAVSATGTVDVSRVD